MTKIEHQRDYADLVSNRYTRLALGGLLSSLALLAYPLDGIANQNLTLHMFQHIGLFVFSALVGYGMERTLITKLNSLKKKS